MPISPGREGLGPGGAEVASTRTKVGSEDPSGLGPHRGMRAVDALALVVEVRAFLHPSVDLGVRRVEVDGRTLRGEVHPALLRQQGEDSFDELGVGPLYVGARLFVEALAQADHRGGRRHVWHGAKSKPGSVVALMVEVAEEVPRRRASSRRATPSHRRA